MYTVLRVWNQLQTLLTVLLLVIKYNENNSLHFN